MSKSKKHHTNLKARVLLSSLLAVPMITTGGDWFFSIGPYVRQDMEMNVSGSSEVQINNRHSATPFFRPAEESRVGGRGLNLPGPDGGMISIDGFANRSYDDGFVNIGSTTGVPGSLATDHTWNWGYNRASQYNMANNTLAYHKTVDSGTRSLRYVDRSTESRRSVRTLLDTGVNEQRDDIDGEGLEATLGLRITSNTTFNVSISLGLNGIEVDEQRIQAQTFRELVNTKTYAIETTHHVTDRFIAEDQYIYLLQDPAGNAITPRAARDHGTFNGLPLPSPLIPNIPDRVRRVSNERTRSATSSMTRSQIGNERFEAWNEIDIDADADVFQLWLGPEFSAEGGRLQAYFRPKLSLNMIDLSVSREEVFKSNRGGTEQILQTWNDQGDDQQWSWGYGITGGLRFDVHEDWFLAFEFGLDWIEKEARVDVGPNEVKFDASGKSASVQIGRAF